ncbi:MAG: PAS domain S-box protein, partial [Syntrophobacteraceae bacterium]
MESEHSKRILVVDDEKSLCLMVLNFFRRAGYDCHSTTNPINALEILEDDNFGLVISDIAMPEMNGLDLIREIRQKHPGIDTLAMTGYTGDYTYSDIIEAGAADFIGKPFELPELRAKVERIERERRMLRALREANAALELAHNRKKAITDSARDAIMMMDPEGMVTYWNPAAERILGYTQEEAIGQDLHRLLAPERFHAAHYAALPKFLETGHGPVVGITRELAARRKDGEEIPVELSLSAAYMNGWHAVGILRDISERKGSEKALRESEEQFKSMFEMASIGMAQADPKTGRWVRVNQKMCEITGYSSDEMLALRIPELTHPEDRDRDWEAFQDVISGNSKNYRLEKRYIRKDGTIVWVNVNMTVIRDFTGQPIRTMATIEDISERKHAEKEMLRLHRKNELILDATDEGIIGLDSTGKITFVNPYAIQTLGYSIDELIGERLHPLVHHSKTNGDRYPLSECPMYESLRLGTASRIRDEVLWKKDGTSFPSVYSSIPITEDGNIVGVVITFRDITRRKQAEERIRQQNESLRDANSKIESLYQRLQREYELAADVFSRVTLTDYSKFSNIRHVSLPVSTVGGDLLLVAPKPSGGMNVLLGDFTGHGLSATIGTIPVVEIFHRMSEQDYCISNIITEINRKLKTILPTGLFFCACILELNSTRDSLTVWNGGMPDAFLVGARCEIKQRFPSASVPLGI